MTPLKTPMTLTGDTPYSKIKALMTRLRDPETGCPWDSVQTFESIAPYTIEEAYEVNDAIERYDMHDLKDELGDLLFQILFHSKIAEEAGYFNMDDVCERLVDKMVSRHPHVFDIKDSQETSAAQKQVWEDVKALERVQKLGPDSSILDDIARPLPALTRAEKLQKRAARVGFDWPDLSGVTDKIAEEAREVSDAIDTGDTDAIEDEIGDLLFSITNLARRMKIDPERALRRTNRKFTSRFQYIEAQAKLTDRDISDLTLNEMEAYWQDAKKKKPSHI